jgi:hypothetical protein
MKFTNTHSYAVQVGAVVLAPGESIGDTPADEPIDEPADEPARKLSKPKKITPPSGDNTSKEGEQ